MTSSPKFDDDAVVAVASFTADAVASQLEVIRNRLPLLLPARCLREIEGDETPKPTERAREQLVMCEAAVAALGHSSRSLCDQSDEMNRLHNHLVRETRRHDRDVQNAAGADRVARRLRGLAWQTDGDLCELLGRLTWARMRGLRSVLLAQLDREFDVRNGRPISPDVELPVGSGDGGGDSELELVPVEPKGPKDPEEGGKGGSGGSGGAAPAVVVVSMPPDPGADFDDDDDDGLDFLDLDRKS